MRVFTEERKSLEEENINGLIQFEVYDDEEMKRKYLEEVNSENYEVQTEEEIAIEDDLYEAAEMLEWLGLEADEIDADMNPDGDPLSSVTNSFATKYENDGEYSTANPEYAEKIKSINKESGIAQLDIDAKIEDDDPLLIKQFEQECERMDQQLAAKRQRRQFTDTFVGLEDSEAIDSERKRFSFEEKKPASGYRSSTGFGFNGFTKNKDKTKSAAEFTVEEDGKVKKEKVYDPEAIERRAKIYHAGIDQMLDVAYHGDKKKRTPKKKSYGRKKWSLKGMWASAKEWMDTSEAKIMAKVGTMLCMQVGMAMMNKQVEFDGAMQAVLFMGMMMGTLWIGRELRAEGIDARRMRFI